MLGGGTGRGGAEVKRWVGAVGLDWGRQEGTGCATPALSRCHAEGSAGTVCPTSGMGGSGIVYGAW